MVKCFQAEFVLRLLSRAYDQYFMAIFMVGPPLGLSEQSISFEVVNMRRWCGGESDYAN